MKKFIFILLFLFACSASFGAELLIQAKDSSFDNGAKKGDIIVVAEDGHVWGKEECLPNYIVYKLPGIKKEDIQHYTQTLTKEEIKVIDGKEITSDVIVKKRKYNIKSFKVEQAISTKSSTLSVASKDVSTFKITEKVLDEKEITIK